MLFQNILNVFFDALFPLSKEEETLLLISPDEVFAKLPKAPPYAGLTVPLANSYSIFAYKDPLVSRLIWALKYKKSQHAVALAGFALWNVICRLQKHEKIIIVPMPITARRRRERGFNQCELVVNEIARLDHSDRIKVRTDLLERVQHTSRQTLKNRSERLESAKGLFRANSSASESHSSSIIVVVDDVITTGSTMKEALDALKAAGFTRVRALSVAH